MNRIKQWIEQGPLLVDGGMGTYFSSKEHLPGSGCEMASIEKPVLISAIHREYLEAGARVIKTNTFAANRPTYPAYGNGAADHPGILESGGSGSGAVRGGGLRGHRPGDRAASGGCGTGIPLHCGGVPVPGGGELPV